MTHIQGRIPTHVAFIPDGNRRFAKKLLEKPWKGHEWGIEKIRTIFEWCKELGIKYITLYALSVENLDKRPKQELDFLLGLAHEEIERVSRPDSFIHKNRVRVNFFGRIERLPEDLQKSLKTLKEQTKNYSDYHLNFAIAYGGRQEILDACRDIAAEVKTGKLKVKEIDEKVFRKYLYTNGLPDPDLIIRTSEQRLSGFLLWQGAYSEIAFIDTLWPELRKEEFFRVIEDFSKRGRRFGK